MKTKIIGFILIALSCAYIYLFGYFEVPQALIGIGKPFVATLSLFCIAFLFLSFGITLIFMGD